MKAIKKSVCILAVASSFSILVTAIIFFQRENRVLIKPFLPLVIVTILLCGLMMWEYRKLITARLIIDNRIIHIQQTKFEIVQRKSKRKRNRKRNNIFLGGIGVDISCFGILLNTKVIKFNTHGIHLTGVEIDQEFITLSYSTEKRTDKIRILHGAIDDKEIHRIANRFRYETGVVPVII